ncbi:MAG: STAS domain-containing protein [Candidatus Eisenbacteria bacterium]|uniref:STAS domain-containing protein n=1 Tax=Eiseniibacteriota bacterium TaxID=2212470 RepID=A0A9D6L9W7_UNCEI|nr:STAS domain-containing protein [Candidatus Eisenbacteria bacterium]MBI3539582.1 STAS domain-containing protein [Candidatus Eisenbacteria bacterium]
MKQRQVESIAILTPKGYLSGGDETDELERVIKTLGEGGNKSLIINLSETQHLNSTALGVLISAHSSYVRRGGQMKLCAVDKRIENIFVITKLSLVFDVFPSEEQAIASFAESKPV